MIKAISRISLERPRSRLFSTARLCKTAQDGDWRQILLLIKACDSLVKARTFVLSSMRGYSKKDLLYSTTDETTLAEFEVKKQTCFFHISGATRSLARLKITIKFHKCWCTVMFPDKKTNVLQLLQLSLFKFSSKVFVFKSNLVISICLLSLRDPSEHSVLN